MSTMTEKRKQTSGAAREALARWEGKADKADKRRARGRRLGKARRAPKGKGRKLGTHYDRKLGTLAERLETLASLRLDLRSDLHSRDEYIGAARSLAPLAPNAPEPMGKCKGRIKGRDAEWTSAGWKNPKATTAYTLGNAQPIISDTYAPVASVRNTYPIDTAVIDVQRAADSAMRERITKARKASPEATAARKVLAARRHELITAARAAFHDKVHGPMPRPAHDRLNTAWHAFAQAYTVARAAMAVAPVRPTTPFYFDAPRASAADLALRAMARAAKARNARHARQGNASMAHYRAELARAAEITWRKEWAREASARATVAAVLAPYFNRAHVKGCPCYACAPKAHEETPVVHAVRAFRVIHAKGAQHCKHGIHTKAACAYCK